MTALAPSPAVSELILSRRSAASRRAQSDSGTVSNLSVPVYKQELWTHRQRQASPLHEVSYRACFKPQLPAYFIERLAIRVSSSGCSARPTAPQELCHFQPPIWSAFRATPSTMATAAGRIGCGAFSSGISDHDLGESDISFMSQLSVPFGLGIIANA